VAGTETEPKNTRKESCSPLILILATQPLVSTVRISATVDHLFPVQLYGVASCATLQWIFSCCVSGDKLGGDDPQLVLHRMAYIYGTYVPL
jgi:hypothetical protein